MSQLTTEIKATPVAEKMTQFRWIIMVLIFLVYTIVAADRANIGIVLPFIKTEFGMSNTEAGVVVSFFFLAYSIGQIPSGFALSKLGIRGSLSISLLLTSIFTGLLGTAGSVFALKVYRFGLGLAEAPLSVGIPATINNWFPPKEKGTATGLFLAASKFGPVIVPPIGAFIIASYGWREIFYWFAVPGVVLSVIWYILVRNSPAENPYCSSAEVEYIKADVVITPGKAATRKQYSLGWLDKLIRLRKVTLIDNNAAVFRSWNIWGCALGYFCMVGIVMVILSWIPTYLITVKGFSVIKMGFVASAPWIGGVAGNILGGWFSDKVLNKRRKPTMFVTAISTVFMMCALIYAPNDALLLSILLFLTGVLLNFGYSSFAVYSMGVATKEKYPLAHSIVNCGGQAGGTIAPLITGMILDAYNWDMVFLFLAACSALCICVISTIDEPDNSADAQIN
ncbi:MAG: MFS transporter [Negativicutes bacterium]|nr:MFS transporter [Negativicutes bacterium]